MLERNSEKKNCDDLRACAFNNWSEKFSKISIESITIPIPNDIVKYLKDEIIILPKECYDNEPENNYDEEDDNDAINTPQPEFRAFSQLLKHGITDLGGSVFIKTNWHSPKDAFWITAGQTMCCKDIADIYQLLKASSICKEDLNCHGLEGYCETNTDDVSSDSSASNTNQYLVLKKWHDIHPGSEYRCFVRNKNIIGISPRDWPQYHEYMGVQRIDIVNDIVSMFKEQIKYKFPLTDYIFDVVRDSKDHVYLVDFSPFGEEWSEPLAFDWTDLIASDDDISEDEDDDPEFRYMSSDCGIQPSKRNNYGIPKDIIDMFRASSHHDSSDEEEDNETQSSSNNPQTNTLDDFINNRLASIVRSQPDLDDDTAND